MAVIDDMKGICLPSPALLENQSIIVQFKFLPKTSHVLHNVNPAYLLQSHSIPCHGSSCVVRWVFFLQPPLPCHGLHNTELRMLPKAEKLIYNSPQLCWQIEKLGHMKVLKTFSIFGPEARSWTLSLPHLT